MQPYFFPYIGYWQLISQVDKFVIFDDVNYINRGWVNRNYFLVNKTPTLLTIPLISSSQNKKINEISISKDINWRKKFLRSIEMSYKKAPGYSSVFPLISNLINQKENDSLSSFLVNSIVTICEFLSIETEIIRSSSKYKNEFLKGSDRIIDIVKKENAKNYVNPIGGYEIYDFDYFKKFDINLIFTQVQSDKIVYYQRSERFFPNLSIVDVMMFNPVEKVQEFISYFNLLENELDRKS